MFDNLSEMQTKALISFGLILVIWIVQMIISRLVSKKIEDIRNRTIWRQAVSYTAFVLALIIIVRLWFAWFQTIFTMLSLIAAAITIVCKEILLNFFSYGVIVWRGLFNVGDRVQIDGSTGDVTGIGLLYITLSETNGNGASTGRITKVPNKVVLDKPVANYTRGADLIWHEIQLKLPAASDWEKARAILTSVVEQLSVPITREMRAEVQRRNEEMMFLETGPSVHFHVEGTSLIYTCRYLCDYRERARSTQQFWEQALTQFKEAGISFASGSSESKD